MKTYNITLRKPSLRRLRDDVIQRNRTALVESILTKYLRTSGWNITDGIPPWRVSEHETHDKSGTLTGKYLYTMRLVCTGPDNAAEHVFASIAHTMAKRAVQPTFGSWELVSVNDKPYRMPADGETPVDTTDSMVGYAQVRIPDDWDSYFSHLYGLDAQISRVKRAIAATIRSDFNSRYNVVLVGDPGCGKSDIADSVGRALASDDAESVWRLDATATTAAGTIKAISELETLPQVVLFEEAEKASEKVTEPWLGILDQRGEVRKVTARSDIQRSARMMVISTVNDYEKFCAMNAGALASRHTVTIWFQRPSREVLAQILTREVQKVHGDFDWIAPTLDYCEDHDISDPRAVIAHCMTGAEGWLDGSYVKELDATSRPA